MRRRIGMKHPVHVAESGVIEPHGAVPGNDATVVIPHSARRVGPVQVRRLVEIPGEQDQVSPLAGNLFEKRRDGLVACRRTVHP